MLEDQDICSHCGEELASPLARARGEHISCVEKSDGAEYIEK